MIEIGRIRSQPCGDEAIGDLLHVLARHAEPAGDLRHRLRVAVGGGAQHLTTRLRLSDHRGCRIAAPPERAGQLINVGDDQ